MDAAVRCEVRAAAAAGDPAAVRTAQARAARSMNLDQRIAALVTQIKAVRQAGLERTCASKAAEDGCSAADRVRDVFGEVVVRIEKGRRYWRVVQSELKGGVERGVSVYCFIDTTNGDLLKAATWKAPAKHARGNLFADDMGFGALREHGLFYLK